MKVLLKCLSVEFLGDRHYLAKVAPVLSDGGSGEPFTIECDCPIAPGRLYELLLKGVFVGYTEDRPCVGSVLAFGPAPKLEAVDVEVETELFDQGVKM